MRVCDTSGRVLFYLDGSRARDVNGKVVACRVGSDDHAIRLSDLAGRWLRGEDASRLVTMDLGVADVATPATQAVFGVPAGECVADAVSDVRYVSHDRGYWYAETVADAVNLVTANSVVAGAGFPELNPAFTPTQFVTTGYGLAARIPRQVANNADFDVKALALVRLVEALRTAREARVAKLLTTATNWASANQVAASAKWNGTTPAPLTDVFNALAKSWLPSDTLVMPENAAPYFFTSTSGVRDYVQAGGELPRILFARAKYLASGAPAYIWSPANPTNVALVRSRASLPTSVTFRWLGDENVEDGERREGVLVREYFSNEDDSFWIVCAHNDVEVLVSNQVGSLIVGALQ